MPQATFTECPKCGAKVRKDKLRRHISGVHGATPKPPKPVEEQVPTRPASTVKFPWKVVAVLAVVSALVVGVGYYFMSSSGPGGGGGGGGHGTVAVMETNLGPIRITLDKVRAPITAAHFIGLANAGKYNGKQFTRVAYNFVIQGGQGADDTTKVAWEFTGLLNSAYTIAMARTGSPSDAASKDTATCQFFINLKDNTNLDTPSVTYSYVVFGRVEDASSQAVVRAIGALYPPGDTTYDGAPTSPVTITSVTITTV